MNMFLFLVKWCRKKEKYPVRITSSREQVNQISQYGNLAKNKVPFLQNTSRWLLLNYGDLYRNPWRCQDCFKNWRRKESYDKKSYDLNWMGALKIFWHYHFHETIEILTKSIYRNALSLSPNNVTSFIEKKIY